MFNTFNARCTWLVKDISDKSLLLINSENYHDSVVSFANNVTCIYLPKHNLTLAFSKWQVLQIHCFSLNINLKNTHTLKMHFWQKCPWLLVLGNVLRKICTIQMQALYEVIFLFYKGYKEPNSIDTVPVKTKFVPESGFSFQRSKVFSSTSFSNEIFKLDS